ncbi:MAG TPA: alkylmercury lyase family protein [Terriglobia bacterium]|nr:alkylmercury lyase family protein [Terriglobia bacterium]
MPVEELALPTGAEAKADLYGALERLNELLPLKQRQQALPKPYAHVHRLILRSLAERGRPLTTEEIAAVLGSRASALHALAVLGSNDLIVLDTKVVKEEAGKYPRLENPEGKILGAYPMTVEETPHRVRVGGPGGHVIHAMCAVDALAISPMFGVETCIDSRCHTTGEPIYICQTGKQILAARPSADLRVGIRWQKFSTSAAHTLCTEMVFLKDGQTAAHWKNTDPKAIELFTLPEAVEYAAAFFLPLLRD